MVYMPLPRDSDTLRVPAFMRKRSLRASARKPLILTALDRKKAGLLPEALQQKDEGSKRRISGLNRSHLGTASVLGLTTLGFGLVEKTESLVRRAKTTTAEKPLKRGWPYVDLDKIASERRRYKKAATTPIAEPKSAPRPESKPKPKIFAMPFVDEQEWSARDDGHGIRYEEPVHTKTASPRQKTIGTMTHFYNKIKVGVIKLTGAVSVGDCITYDTEDGPYEQVIESMELNREPIFKAGRGKDIGLKLKKNPRIGCKVYK